MPRVRVNTKIIQTAFDHRAMIDEVLVKEKLTQLRKDFQSIKAATSAFQRNDKIALRAQTLIRVFQSRITQWEAVLIPPTAENIAEKEEIQMYLNFLKSGIVRILIMMWQEYINYGMSKEKDFAWNNLQAFIPFHPIMPISFAEFPNDINDPENACKLLWNFFSALNQFIQTLFRSDIKIERLRENIGTIIDEIQSKVPRCDNAFSKMRQAVLILETSFGNYYERAILAGNMGIIYEIFIQDVMSKYSGQSESLMLRHQFNQIVIYLRKKFAEQSMHRPHVIKKLLSEYDRVSGLADAEESMGGEVLAE